MSGCGGSGHADAAPVRGAGQVQEASARGGPRSLRELARSSRTQAIAAANRDKQPAAGLFSASAALVSQALCPLRTRAAPPAISPSAPITRAAIPSPLLALSLEPLDSETSVVASPRRSAARSRYRRRPAVKRLASGIAEE